MASYNNNRKFGANILLDNDNAGLCTLNPYCAPSFMERSTIQDQRDALFQTVDQTTQKDVWGPGTCCLRQALLQTELEKGWTVFQRRTFKKTPVLWFREAQMPPEAP